MFFPLFNAFPAQYGPIVSNISSQKSVAESVLYLIDIFNLIEFFGFASLFGWFTFAQVNDKSITEIHGKNGNETKKKQEIARRNLFVINNYFLISFFFYGMAGIGDYLYWHSSHPYPEFLSKSFLNYASIDSFIVATLLLTVPFLIVNSIGRFGKDLSDIPRPAPFYYTVLILVATVVSSVSFWSTDVCSMNVTASNLIYGFVAYASTVGLFFYWNGERVRKRLMFANLILLSLAPLWIMTFVRGFAILYHINNATTCPWFWF